MNYKNVYHIPSFLPCCYPRTSSNLKASEDLFSIIELLMFLLCTGMFTNDKFVNCKMFETYLC